MGFNGPHPSRDRQKHSVLGDVCRIVALLSLWVAAAVTFSFGVLKCEQDILEIIEGSSSIENHPTEGGGP